MYCQKIPCNLCNLWFRFLFAAEGRAAPICGENRTRGLLLFPEFDNGDDWQGFGILTANFSYQFGVLP